MTANRLYPNERTIRLRPTLRRRVETRTVRSLAEAANWNSGQMATSSISPAVGATLPSSTTTGKISGGDTVSGATLMSVTTAGKMSGGKSASGEHTCVSASPSRVTSSANDTWRLLGGHSPPPPPENTPHAPGQEAPPITESVFSDE